MPPFVVGLTGSIGAGKSTVADFLKFWGCDGFNADWEARLILLENAGELRSTKPQWFYDGQISYRNIANDIFSNEDRYKEYCVWIWGLVRQRLLEKIQSSQSKILIYDAPMLFEAGGDATCDITLAVVADDELRYARVMERSGLSREEIRERDQRQISQQEKIRRATYTIENNGTLEELEEKVREFFEESSIREAKRGR
jgi:dephospho-CoA kinase